jgi:hypothetical protein
VNPEMKMKTSAASKKADRLQREQAQHIFRDVVD